MEFAVAAIFCSDDGQRFCGVGMMLSAMAIRFRDVRHALHYMVQMLMYSAPIVYSASNNS
jgi:ABC-type polysaccharide/polyol phosphate export permease